MEYVEQIGVIAAGVVLGGLILSIFYGWLANKFNI